MVCILLALIVLFSVPVWYGMKKWPKSAKTEPVPRWKQMAGATLGMVILLTVTLGTWWQAVGRKDAVPSDTIFARTLPGPTLECEEAGGYGPAKEVSCQMIFRVYLVRARENTPRIVRGQSAVFRWPEEKNRQHAFTFDWKGMQYEISLSAAEIYMGGDEISVSGRSRWKVFDPMRNRRSGSSEGGGVAYLDQGHLLSDNILYPVTSHHPLSLWPKNTEELAVWVEVELAQRDDPLVETSAYEADLLPLYRTSRMAMTGPVFGSVRQSPGIALLDHWGPAAVFLLLACVAGSLCFKRSGIAFVYLLFCAVLYSGTLERVLIHRLAAIACDAEHPLADRCAAVENLRDVFFHPQLSKSVLQDLVANPSLPKPLRQIAQEVRLPRRYSDTVRH